jgi:2-oxoglutarate dehydrogenase complex dihydrolipoamide succinyltransferase (E2) component
MKIEIVMPQMGESVAEGTVVTWLKQVGDPIARDEPVVAISTDKVDVEIPAPAAGMLSEIRVREGQVVPVGEVLGYIGDSAEPSPAAAASLTAEPVAGTPAVPLRAGPAAPRGESWYSPSVRQLANEHGVDLAQVTGTGAEGRVTRQDVLSFIDRRREPGVAPARAARRPGETADDRVLPVSHLRKTIAANMLRSKQTAPHVTQIHEADLTAIASYRESNGESFLRQTGTALTFLPFVLKAAAEALRAHPLLNATYSDEAIVIKGALNIGVAVALEEGLIVPVMKEADRKGFVALAQEAADLARRARQKRLSVEEVLGGTFTVNNLGAFGALMGTPILVQPQVGILGYGRVIKRPAVIDDTIAIRSMAYLCLSYDHRLIDGAYAGAFLNDLQRRLEEFDFSSIR